MEVSDHPILPKGPVSDAFRERGIHTFGEACRFVQNLPYGRNLDKSDPLILFRENRGTCGTKHALLKTLADEQEIARIRLFTGIFRMNPQNTPRIAPVLERHDLPYMPEAHCYLRYGEQVLDFTFAGSHETVFLSELVCETEITPAQITAYKVAYHRAHLAEWLHTSKMPYTPDELWAIREACIAALAE